MFNQFQNLFNHLLVNKQNTDRHTVCNTESTLAYTVQFWVQKVLSYQTVHFKIQHLLSGFTGSATYTGRPVLMLYWVWLIT